MNSTRCKHWRYLTHNGACPLTVRAEPVRRRIQALAALGWTARAIAVASGLPHRRVSELMMAVNQRCTLETSAAIRAAYERCCLIRPTGRYAELARTRAALKGWPTPLAWDDIDNDAEPADLSHLKRMVA